MYSLTPPQTVHLVALIGPCADTDTVQMCICADTVDLRYTGVQSRGAVWLKFHEKRYTYELRKILPVSVSPSKKHMRLLLHCFGVHLLIIYFKFGYFYINKFAILSPLPNSFGKIKKSKMADLRWPPFGNQDVNATSCDNIGHVGDLKASIFGCYMYPPRFAIIALILSRPSPGSEIPKTLMLLGLTRQL